MPWPRSKPRPQGSKRPAPAEGDQPIHHVYKDCRYLGLEKALVHNPSAGTFLAIRRRARQRRPDATTGSLLALAPSFERPEQVAARVLPALVRGSRLRGLASLTHTADEVRRITSLIPRSRPWVGSEASEARFKSEAGRFRILHLATHGLVDDDMPMSSGVLLEGGDGEDGLLQANEILRLRLNADLVILSSCRSGRGALQRGQGIVGLSRAFLFAGASAVAVSLWDVDDRSTPLPASRSSVRPERRRRGSRAGQRISPRPGANQRTVAGTRLSAPGCRRPVAGTRLLGQPVPSFCFGRSARS